MAKSFPSIFNPDDVFFVIDSDHLEETRTAFYGFTFLNDAVIDSLEALKGQTPEEDGAYVYLRREGNRLTITQDFIGSWGLYLYRQGDYFALSNSFLYLVEYLRDKRAGLPIEVPKNYYPDDDDTRAPMVTWRSHANLLYANWLNYMVYQTTPYDLNEIREQEG